MTLDQGVLALVLGFCLLIVLGILVFVLTRGQVRPVADPQADPGVAMEVRQTELAERADRLRERTVELDHRQAALDERTEDYNATLAVVAGMNRDAARQKLMATLEREAKLRAATTIRDIERQAGQEAESRARRVLATAIQRLAAPLTAEAVVSVVPIAGDDIKGRIIGREGRNVRHFEQVTGVNLIIDDTPDAVLLSCFQPVRREVARLTLVELVADGRIYPSRIEEVFQASQVAVDGSCVRAGQDAVLEIGIADMDDQLVRILGQLRYRTSYGQNVLGHVVETAHLAQLMATEIGLDPTITMRGALLHDIGKALTHEASGSHALVGAALARRHGESADVVHAIEAHHNEVEPQTVEAVLVQAADAISGSRPGARRDSLEAYVHRLHRLEEIALSRDGVEKVYAMQAGRELRVMVRPKVVDDIAAQVLARDIAKQVEEELTYPGQVLVTVIRESRSTEVAR